MSRSPSKPLQFPKVLIIFSLAKDPLLVNDVKEANLTHVLNNGFALLGIFLVGNLLNRSPMEGRKLSDAVGVPAAM